MGWCWWELITAGQKINENIKRQYKLFEAVLLLFLI